MDGHFFREYQNRHAVAGPEIAERLARGGRNPLDVTRHAAADIQQKDERKLLRLAPEIYDSLRLAVLGDDEILLGQALDQALAFQHLGVHPDVGHSRSEGGLPAHALSAQTGGADSG